MPPDALTRLVERVRRVYDPVEGFPEDWSLEACRIASLAVVSEWEAADRPVPQGWTDEERDEFYRELDHICGIARREVQESHAEDPDADPFPELPEGTPYHAYVLGWLARGCPLPFLTKDEENLLREADRLHVEQVFRRMTRALQRRTMMIVPPETLHRCSGKPTGRRVRAHGGARRRRSVRAGPRRTPSRNTDGPEPPLAEPRLNALDTGEGNARDPWITSVNRSFARLTAGRFRVPRQARGAARAGVDPCGPGTTGVDLTPSQGVLA